RLAIALLKQQACQGKKDSKGFNNWGFILYTVTALQIDGMSDEEDGKEDGQPIRLVLDVNFRCQEFQSLF
ncbi:hypothetical protein GYMLUDRAFT_170312, partial [Collybiopsis luxurians FD-317 M1]